MVASLILCQGLDIISRNCISHRNNNCIQSVLFNRCYRGDIMGCGIQYPCDYVTTSDKEEDDDFDVEDEKIAGNSNDKLY